MQDSTATRVSGPEALSIDNLPDGWTAERGEGGQYRLFLHGAPAAGHRTTDSLPVDLLLGFGVWRKDRVFDRERFSTMRAIWGTDYTPRHATFSDADIERESLAIRVAVMRATRAFVKFAAVV